MEAALAGLVTGLSLIVAIGAQNAYVLRLGLARTHVGLAVAICAAADALLILAGVAGLGALVRTHDGVLRTIAVLGAAYLAWFAIRSFRNALRPEALTPTGAPTRSARRVAVIVLGLTFLNPHVYLDTVLLLGTIGSTFGDARWWFALGAALASVVWFGTLGYGARLLAPLMARPVTWRILDTTIGVVMTVIAIGLLWTALT
jgi:L-lysine exporter family protein LysE/ArgO